MSSPYSGNGRAAAQARNDRIARLEFWGSDTTPASRAVLMFRSGGDKALRGRVSEIVAQANREGRPFTVEEQAERDAAMLILDRHWFRAWAQPTQTRPSGDPEAVRQCRTLDVWLGSDWRNEFE